MKIKTLSDKNNLKEKIKQRIEKEKSSKTDSKFLIFKKNFRNNQNYVLGKKQKRDNIIFFLSYKGNTDIFENLFFHKLTWLSFLFFRFANFSIKITLLLLLGFFGLIFIISSLSFGFNYYFFLFFIMLLIPFKDYFNFKNYDSFVYKVTNNGEKFSRFRKKIYGISNKYAVYDKNNIEGILQYDIMFKNKIKEK